MYVVFSYIRKESRQSFSPFSDSFLLVAHRHDDNNDGGRVATQKRRHRPSQYSIPYFPVRSIYRTLLVYLYLLQYYVSIQYCTVKERNGSQVKSTEKHDTIRTIPFTFTTTESYITEESERGLSAYEYSSLV